MSKLKSASRKLKPFRVGMAKRVELAKHELAMKMVSERVKIDAEFAADVLKIGGDMLRPDIKKDAEETIRKEETARLVKKRENTGLLDGVKSDVDPKHGE